MDRSGSIGQDGGSWQTPSGGTGFDECECPGDAVRGTGPFGITRTTSGAGTEAGKKLIIISPFEPSNL